MNTNNDEKYVDEAWKESVADEKEKDLANKTKVQSQPKSPEPEEPRVSSEKKPEESSASEDTASEGGMNFLEYLTSLAYQAMVFLGEVPHPVTNLTEKDLQQAKMLIDTLLVLRTKTKGNLTRSEENTLNAALYELQMRFVETMRQEQRGSS